YICLVIFIVPRLVLLFTSILIPVPCHCFEPLETHCQAVMFFVASRSISDPSANHTLITQQHGASEAEK
ncbi:hypothetical protein ATANTOWER_018216, partial [Ataeniobius toweri]|nr:hypothetical protein [Ataeniobius toweri]